MHSYIAQALEAEPAVLRREAKAAQPLVSLHSLSKY